MSGLFSNPLSRRHFLKQLGIGSLGAAAALVSLPFSGEAKTKDKASPYTSKTADVVDSIVAKDFNHLLGGKIPGFSDKQLQEHFKLYNGYVKKTNELTTQIKGLSDADLGAANATYSLLRELTIELSFAHNGVTLHELYFANMGNGSAPSSEITKMISRDFGSMEQFSKHFVALGKAMRGWALLGFDMLDGKLRNYGMDMHHQWMPSHVFPLLVMDVYEHAYMIDFATNRGDYIKLFMENIDWQAVHNRLIYAVHHLKSGPSVTI